MSEKFYDNRELSWLKFNERVLEEAQDTETPLFERLRFVQKKGDTAPWLFLVEGKKGSAPGFRIQSPLIIEKEHVDEMIAILEDCIRS